MNKNYIINLKGKQYATYAGVLDEAHRQGLTKIETELVKTPKEGDLEAIVHARVYIKDKTFEAYGDASPKNVNTLIATALIRMAETRAKGRALRDATNIGETLIEELPQGEASKAEVVQDTSKTPNAPVNEAQALKQRIEESDWGQKKEPPIWTNQTAYEALQNEGVRRHQVQFGEALETITCDECGMTTVFKWGEVKQGKNKGRYYAMMSCTSGEKHKPALFKWLE